MNREYRKWYSPSLQRDMELLVFGHAGTPVVAFPTSMGRFYDYEDRGMIAAIAGRYESGQLQAFCVDSVDKESWYNRAVHPKYRALRQNDYDRYLVNELVPFVQSVNPSRSLITTGCSFGGYHAINLAMRHPGIVSGAVSMGAAFDIHPFINGYYDENCYFNCPPDFVPNIADPELLERLSRQRIVLATGERDICLRSNLDFSAILDRKRLPHLLDVWGDGAEHDWPWWRRMAEKHLVP